MITRQHVQIRGTIQGVGFRPFVARLANELGLAGRVWNSSGSVVVEVEGPEEQLGEFTRRLSAEAPGKPRAQWTLSASEQNLEGFHIEPSDAGSAGGVPIPPDIAPCKSCRNEVDSDSDRHGGYPFTSCTDCGARVSILREPPYDRVRTTMGGFPLCAACNEEYSSPSDRRHHAQAIACPACGPSLTLSDRSGAFLAHGGSALEKALEALRRGEIVALKGVGGYQLLVNACDESAVSRLRSRKRRPEKPLAVMFADVDAVRRCASVDGVERDALEGAAAPIVLLDKQGDELAPSIAPGSRRLGAMLPASPLHYLLASRLEFPVVATSGNPHEEPIALKDDEARARLGSIADVFLGHNREIVRRLDDSVIQVVLGRTRVLRMARGLAPMTIRLPVRTAPLIATGGHLKNAPAAAIDSEVVLWPHVGDLSSHLARCAMRESMKDMLQFLGHTPSIVATDMHPDYASTLWAEASGLRRIAIQHHHAHIAACLAEHGIGRALGVAWDGFGMGTDGELWGGDFLEVGPEGYSRVAHLRRYRVPGFEKAATDSWRALAGVSAEAGLSPQPLDPELERFKEIVSSPRLATATSSVGRLFDAVAGLTGLARWSSFEGQAAMAVEDAATPGAEPYPFVLRGTELDWRPAWAGMVEERLDPERVASRFHATLIAMIVRVAENREAKTVALAGGCFQNRLLLAGACEVLEAKGIRVVAPEQVPTGDGGLALGQAWVAGHELSLPEEE